MNLQFSTDGTWEGTTLLEEGVEVPSSALRLEIITGRDAWGEMTYGGVGLGGDMTEFLQLQDGGAVSLFPGRIELNFPGGQVIVEQPSVIVGVNAAMIVWFNGELVSDRLLALSVDVDYNRNVIGGQIELYRPVFLADDEIVVIPLV